MEPLKKSFPSILGNIELVGDTGVWQISADTEELEAGLQLIHLKLTAPEASPNSTCRAAGIRRVAGVICQLKAKPRSAVFFDTTGNVFPGSLPESGYSYVPIPVSGLLVLSF